MSVKHAAIFESIALESASLISHHRKGRSAEGYIIHFTVRTVLPIMISSATLMEMSLLNNIHECLPLSVHRQEGNCCLLTAAFAFTARCFHVQSFE